MSKYFVTAIGTDSGKTLVSTILTLAIKGSYWKPIQAGEPRDTDFVSRFAPVIQERYVLNTPASPHYAARVDGIELHVADFDLPAHDPIVVEGAGGMMVPINDHELVIDIADSLQLPVILVCNLYLGSINHSLLSIDYLKRRQLPVAGIIFNGPPNPSSEEIIEKYCPWPVLLRIPQLPEITGTHVTTLADELRQNLGRAETGKNRDAWCSD